MFVISDEKITVTMATLESRCHEVNSIKSGTKLYNAGQVEYGYRDDNRHYFRVKDKYDAKTVILSFTHDGCDLHTHFCNCCVGSDGDCLCKHIVASVFAMQGGIIESKIALGMTATASTIVTESNTAKTVGSGSLDVFATPMMIALMERAACACLADELEPGQTSVGTKISALHTAASPIGMHITANATIEYVFGRKIEFVVTASDETGEIGKGKHTRMIVDVERFMGKTHERKI